MADSLDEKHNENGMNLATAPAARASADPAAEARKARIKKMRGWLSPRDSVADDFGPEDAALYYGEGHNGWNR
ncbi:hypothetical protein [uncultured Fibrobacter sp.]|uniref:hypothetical protein n=1 Tax=uncultured Fibrobacter sp. TaxID=261512 RepID=UPI0025EBC577|nr:hypothetical protein [uncultured Fibrobacter sp.]